MRIEVDVDKAAVERGLTALARELDNWRPAWAGIRDDFMLMEQQRFAEQPWEPHGPMYMQWDDPVTGNSYLGGQILDATGGLKATLTTPKVALETNNRSMLLGSRYHASSNTGKSVPVAALMHEGFRVRGRISVRTATGYARPKISVSVPPRPLFDVGEGDKLRWVRIVSDWVGFEIAKVGL